jgi:aspartyl-tRNA(Asn)/glutamyl-tRNA(Gln) amidotransferase subunit A
MADMNGKGLRAAIDDPRRAVNVERLTERFLGRIEAWQERCNPFITVDGTVARGDAAASQEALDHNRVLGPAHGSVVAVKDDIEVAGMACTVGTALYRTRVPAEDAEVVRRLRQSGAIIIGKTGLHEWAYGVTCDNQFYGTIRNAWDPARIPGGSSGGSGVAVAADLCIAALGSDAGGSIRVPAALNGVSGFRPTSGSIPPDGTHPISWSFETVGPMARSVVDVSRVYDVIRDPGSAPAAKEFETVLAGQEVAVKGLRVGLADDYFLSAAEPEIASAIRDVADVFHGMGAHVHDVGLADTHEAIDAAQTAIRAEAWAIHQERASRTPQVYGDEVLARLLLGKNISGPELARAYATGRNWSHGLSELWGEVDLLLAPTVPRSPDPIAGADMIRMTEDMTRFTLPFSVAGVPALSIPCGFTEDGLPIGAQIVGRRRADELVLLAGAAFQQVTAWHRLRPPDAVIGEPTLGKVTQ